VYFLTAIVPRLQQPWCDCDRRRQGVLRRRSTARSPTGSRSRQAVTAIRRPPMALPAPRTAARRLPTAATLHRRATTQRRRHRGATWRRCHRAAIPAPRRSRRRGADTSQPRRCSRCSRAAPAAMQAAPRPRSPPATAPGTAAPPRPARRRPRRRRRQAHTRRGATDADSSVAPGTGCRPGATMRRPLRHRRHWSSPAHPSISLRALRAGQGGLSQIESSES